MHNIANAESTHLTKASPVSTVRILVIDDDPHFQRFMRSLFRHKRYGGEFARSGREGLRLARSLRPDLILIDLGLPDMNGLEVYRDLKAGEDTKQIPVLLMSGLDDPFRIHPIMAEMLHADDFLRKPFGENEFLSHVRRLLDSKRLPSSDGRKGDAERITKGCWTIDYGARQVLVAERLLEDLTRSEFDLLGLVFLRSPIVVEWRELADAVGNIASSKNGAPKALRVHVNNLRRKLGLRGCCLRTRRGVGLQFDPSKA